MEHINEEVRWLLNWQLSYVLKKGKLAVQWQNYMLKKGYVVAQWHSQVSEEAS